MWREWRCPLTLLCNLKWANHSIWYWWKWRLFLSRLAQLSAVGIFAFVFFSFVWNSLINTFSMRKQRSQPFKRHFQMKCEILWLTYLKSNYFIIRISHNLYGEHQVFIVFNEFLFQLPCTLCDFLIFADYYSIICDHTFFSQKKINWNM